MKRIVFILLIITIVIIEFIYHPIFILINYSDYSKLTSQIELTNLEKPLIINCMPGKDINLNIELIKHKFIKTKKCNLITVYLGESTYNAINFIKRNNIKEKVFFVKGTFWNNYLLSQCGIRNLPNIGIASKYKIEQVGHLGEELLLERIYFHLTGKKNH